jgi:type II secretory pathway pseudopilin PulG
MTPKRSFKGGFTLIETLVSFIILGLAAGTIVSIIGKNPIKISHLENLRHATAAAKSVLASVGNEKEMTAGTQTGQLPDGTRWILTMQKYVVDEDAQKDMDFKTAPVTLPYLITVTATSGIGETAASSTLTSLRLTSPPP